MLWIGSGRFDGRIGDGNGQRTCDAPDAGICPSAQADGTVRQLAWGTRSGEATISSTLGAVDREWPLRWANRRRQQAADVPCARCRIRRVGNVQTLALCNGLASTTEATIYIAHGSHAKPRIADARSTCHAMLPRSGEQCRTIRSQRR